MMRLITGVPGAGKTLFSVSEIVKAVKDGRQVFTNIEGMDLEGVYPLDDKDWREYPDGSLIVYDEAHQVFRATGRPGLSDDPIISDMDMHRHRGFDLWFITQFPTKVHHEIRNMVDEHYHLLRQFGAKQATLYKWPESVDVKDQSQRSVADKALFRYPKECFKYYKSASEHTAKLRIPVKLKFLAVVISCISAAVGYRLVSAGGFESLGASQDQQILFERSAGANGEAKPPSPAADSSPVAVGGCVYTDTHCQCYTPQMQPIAESFAACMNRATQPLATGLMIGQKD